MKKVALLFLFAIVFNGVYADQLAYISQEDANKAVALIKKMKKAIDYCGCCDNMTPYKIKIQSVEARFTNYENYYEVYVTYKDSTKKLKTIPVDLAYLWIKYKGEIQTVGTVLGLEHDPCVKTLSWKVKKA